MKKKLYFFFFLLLAGFSTTAWCQKIVYPWRATTAVVLSGGTFEVWADMNPGQTVSSIQLVGPYNSVTPTFKILTTTKWTYDLWSGNTCNLKLKVKVPKTTPADKYTLVLNTSTGVLQSAKSVNVVKKFKSSFYIMHISDAHRYETSGEVDKTKTLREISTIIELSNVIDPAFLIETGDNIWGNNEPEASWTNRCNIMWSGYENGTEHVNGLYDACASILSTPGNHDCLSNNDYKEPDSKRPSVDWNRNFGLQNFGIAYGRARIISANVGWAVPDNASVSWQFDQLKTWINSVGAGKMIIGMCHKPVGVATDNFYNAFKSNNTPFDLMLTGHTHKTKDNPITVDSKPMNYTALNNKYSASRGICPFNLYKIDLIKRTFTPMGNTSAANFGVSTAFNYNSKKVNILYSKTNLGTNSDNTATVTNDFDFEIDDTRIRFVLPKGYKYSISKGTISQEFDGTNFHIVDVRVDIEANSTTIVNIYPH